MLFLKYTNILWSLNIDAFAQIWIKLNLMKNPQQFAHYIENIFKMWRGKEMIALVYRFTCRMPHYVTLCKYCAKSFGSKTLSTRKISRFGNKSNGRISRRSYSAEQLSCLQTTKFDLTIRSNILQRYVLCSSWNL